MSILGLFYFSPPDNIIPLRHSHRLAAFIRFLHHTTAPPPPPTALSLTLCLEDKRWSNGNQRKTRWAPGSGWGEDNQPHYWVLQHPEHLLWNHGEVGGVGAGSSLTHDFIRMRPDMFFSFFSPLGAVARLTTGAIFRNRGRILGLFTARGDG